MKKKLTKMSDVERIRSISTLLHSFAEHEHCDLRFAAGLRIFADSLTPSHSLTSRTPSLRALIRQYLDQPFLEVLTNYLGKWNHSLLEGKLLSEMPYNSSSNSADRDPNEMAVDWYIRNIHAWDWRLRKAIHSVQNPGLPNRTPKTIEEWEFSINAKHAGIPMQNETMEVSESSRFVNMLDRARLILQLLAYLRPKSGTIPSERRRQVELTGVEVPLTPILDSRTRPQGESYCELCWRTTMRSEALKTQRHTSSPASQARKLSNRYCHIHNPGDSKSKYRRDLPYKKTFHNELLVFDFGIGRSKFFLPPILPRNPDEQEVRKAIYEMIRVGKYSRSSKQSATPRLMQRILSVRSTGMTQSEIAQQLGVSKQVVSAQMKKIRAYLKERSEAIYDPSSMN